MFLKAAIICCLIATAIAADDSKTKKRDPRGKRNLEYNLSHHHYHNPNFRSERRISLGPHLTRYPTFFPGRQLSYRKGRPQSLPPPPYAVQMEPLVQYSQRDPLYDPNLLHVPPVNQNDLTKAEDLASDHNHVSQNVYGPPKHVIERPIYIKEPEPIIEIIIKESNVTYPPIEVPVTPAPKKKEQVQVFYVKYKKNPHGKGKDSIVYDKPVPAISPPIKDEEEHPHYEEYKQPELITSPPPASTTLRAIIKPESETFHAHKGIHITFGKEHTQEQLHDDVNEESAPEPAVSLPQGREFSDRPPIRHGPESFGTDVSRIPQSYRPFNQPPLPTPTSDKFPQFGRKIVTSQFPPPSRNPPPPFPSRHPPSSRNPPISFSNFARSPHNQPPSGSISFRQPVPYQPFDQIKPQDKPVQFPRTHTHFPIRQQLPSSNSPTVFNQHHLQQNRPAEHQDFSQPIVPSQAPQIRPPQELRHQQILTRPNLQLLPNLQQHQQFHQQQIPNQHEFVRQQQQLQEEIRQHEQIKQQQFRLQQQQQQKPQQQFVPQAPFVPPGGELIESVPKYEQHFSVGNNGQLQPQDPKQPLHVTEIPKQEHNRPFSASSQFKIHVQPQFQQPSVSKKEESVVQIQPSQETEKLKLAPNFEEFRSHNAQAERHNLQLEQIQRQNQQIEQLQRQKQEIEQIQRQKQQIELQRQQQIQQYQQQFNPHLYNQNQSPVYISNSNPPSSTTPSPTSTTPKLPETTTRDPKELNLQLPDEVPDDLRQHLLSSGILNNADISVLDYDKVGDIPISALPPDQLANFFNAGGAQQIASGSAPVPAVVKPDSTSDLETEASENINVKAEKPAVEMKVVHYDPETEEGKRLQDSYVNDDATQTDPVELSDSNYNRYLPLRLSGAQFPIPDIPELKGKKINSVVVLAPVDYKFEANRRVTREADAKFEGIKFPKGSPLKQLIDDPSKENFDKFLESESKTAADQQSVILLVTGSPEDTKEGREIFMYDIVSKTVSKLSGELSSAFVDAAEANTDDTTVAASNLVEVRVPSPQNIYTDRVDNLPSDLEHSPSEVVETKIRIIDPMQTEMEPEASEQLERFVDVSGQDLQSAEDRQLIANKVGEEQ